MTDLPQISEAEFEVMKIVWKYAPINTNEITERLLKTTAWSPKTIQTLIKRLVTKGALTYEKQGRVFVYTPLVGPQNAAKMAEIGPEVAKSNTKIYEEAIKSDPDFYKMYDAAVVDGLVGSVFGMAGVF